MPSGITFTNKEEALEYASQKEDEGYRVARHYQGGIWIVTLLGIGELPFKGRYESSGEIILPPKASTKTRLHELAHKELGHKAGWLKRDELIDNEIDAEIWAREKMSREITPRVGLPAFATLIIDFGYEESEARGLVVDRLRAKGIEVSETDLEDLKQFEV